MRIYNTLTKQIEDFIPKNENEVKMYTCGPTVYHFAHIGNLRTYIFEDIFEKSLNYLGYNVNRFMNITDLGHLTNDSDDGEDKMSKSAKEQNKSVEEIAKFYTESFYNDIEKLNIKKPDKIDNASNAIEEYIKITEDLIKRDFAYLSDGNVYFDVSKYEDYYKLSGRNKEDNVVGAREDVEEDINKRNPADFGLWFTKSKFVNQVQKYDSPWGVGYPGWHIECTGLAIKYLGEDLDIHCGGVDNIFPHHSNEIAQSESYLGHKWCNYWVHGEHLTDKRGKMSKSNGDSLILKTLIDKGYNPLSYRYMALSSHYRNQLIFSYEALDIAENTYLKLKQKIKSLKKENVEINKNIYDKYINEFKESLKNDLNTSKALTVIYDVLKENVNDDTKIKIIEETEKVLSLDLFKEDKKEIDKELLDLINEKIKLRNEAKQNKDYALADKIRDELKEMSVIIKDTKDETTFEIM